MPGLEKRLYPFDRKSYIRSIYMNDETFDNKTEIGNM